MPPKVPTIAAAVLADKLTFLSLAALAELHEAVRAQEARGAEGILIEAGSALGGSAIVMAHAKAQARPFAIFDMFGMIPAPGEGDDRRSHARYEVIRSGRAQGFGGDRYYGYEENLLQKVQDNFRRHGIEPAEHSIRFVKGRFQETLAVDQPVVLAHLDGDWYESTMTCLQRIEPHLVVGGVIVVDDYFDWAGCRRAVDEYFASRRGRYRFIRRSRVHIVRTAPG